MCSVDQASPSKSCLSSVLSHYSLTSDAGSCFYTPAPENSQPTLQKENEQLEYWEEHPVLGEKELQGSSWGL